jgi:hypothetical protein
MAVKREDATNAGSGPTPNRRDQQQMLLIAFPLESQVLKVVRIEK